METRLISISHWGMHKVPVTKATKAFIERQVIATNLTNMPTDEESYWTVSIEMDDPVDADFDTWGESVEYVQERLGERLAEDKHAKASLDCEFLRFYYNDDLERVVVEASDFEVTLED